MKITILTDNPDSWILPYVQILNKELSKKHNISHVYSTDDVKSGDILFLLSCEKIVKESTLELNKNNIVVHPSKLPEGKGWSPLAWQLLDNVNKIPISLFEAVNRVDSGDVYILDYIELEGTELNDTIKHLQGEKTIEMINKYVNEYPMIGYPQIGKETFFNRRKEKDNELDITKSIDSQFNLLRIVDNDRYPAFFYKNGIKYTLKIFKDE